MHIHEYAQRHILVDIGIDIQNHNHVHNFVYVSEGVEARHACHLHCGR